MTSNINGAYYTAAPTLTDAEYIVTPGTQAYTSQQSFPCKKATILGTTIYYAADFTPFGKTDSYSPDGSAERPFIISNTDGWDYFCDALQDNDTWNRFRQYGWLGLLLQCPSGQRHMEPLQRHDR